MFNAFFHGRLDVSRLNYAIDSFSRKTLEADKIHMLRPICLINVLFKWLTKVVNNRTVSLASIIIDPLQNAFIEGHFILNGVILLHETLHEVCRGEIKCIDI